MPKAVQGIPSLCFVGEQTQEWMQISDLLRVYILTSPPAISAQDSNSRERAPSSGSDSGTETEMHQKSSIAAINIQIFHAISMQKDTFTVQCLIHNESSFLSVEKIQLYLKRMSSWQHHKLKICI